MRFQVKAAAIDLDGTLLDTLPDIAEAARRMLRELGRPEVETAVVRGYIGNGIPRLVKRLLTGAIDGEPDAQRHADGLAAFQRHYRQTYLTNPRPFEGVVEGLERMRQQGLRLACVTNKSQAFTVPLLEHTGLAAFFDLVVSGDSLAAKKPDPLPLLHVAERFALPPAQVLVIGDSDNDTRCARAAGCPVLCVPYGYRGNRAVRELDCDAIVFTLTEAARLVSAD